jgi:peptidoglycan/LPS O-acetylase OafA/YrhL
MQVALGRADAPAALAAVPSTWIDWAKALASQLIIWHHLALYGPMCDVARELAPALLDGLAEHARLVVQVFLVTGGFLAAHTLWPAPGAGRAPAWKDVPAWWWRRYVRLVKPYGVALMAVVVAAWLARGLIGHPTIPAAPEPAQLLAHLLLLHDVFGVESLSAGFWYVAIDFQLYGLLLLLAAAWRSLPGDEAYRTGAAVAIVLAMVLSSLLVWNRISGGDPFATYFFGAYGLGVLARWVRGLRFGRSHAAMGVALVVGLALIVEWRSRIALAGAVALFLCFAPEPAAPISVFGRWVRAVVAFLARISYPVFVLHYAVILITGALVNSAWPESPVANALGMIAAWGLSLVAGAALQRWLERAPTGQPVPSEA